MTYKMKGHSLPGPNQKKSPAKQSAGGTSIERDRDRKLGDSFRSKRTIEKRHQKNTLERAEGERKSEVADTAISKEQAEQRKYDNA